MTNYHRFYDFKIEDTNAGYFEIKDDGSEIYMMAKFKMGDEIYENPFWLKYTGDRVTAYKTGQGDWVDFTTFDEDHYPSSAYPLFLSRVKDELEYIGVNEGKEEVSGRRTLKRDGDEILELQDGKVGRKFRMKDGIPIEINWNGPVSHLKSSLIEAKAGSPLAEE